MAKKSFILYNDQKEIIDELNDEEAGKLLKAIYEYNVNQKITLTGSLKLIFILFKTSFDRDGKKWNEISEKRSEAGKKHTGNQYTRNKEKIENLEQMEQNGTNGSVNVSVSDSVNVNDNVSVNVNDSVCVINNTQDTPDTHDTVFQFSILEFEEYDECDLKKSCRKFFNYYNERKWNNVNDWKEKLRLWIETDIDNGKIKEKQNYEIINDDGFKYKNGRRVL